MRLKSLQKTFKNNPENKERYAESIQDRMQKGYVRKLSKEEVSIDSKGTCFLPPRCVINPMKPDRLRRVYDASAKFKVKILIIKCTQDKDYSLSLFQVLLRFCKGSIMSPAVMALWGFPLNS